MSRGTQDSGGSRKDVAYGAVTRYGRPFQARLAIPSIAHFRIAGPTTPPPQAGMVWATPRSLAATSGIISFPRGT